MPKVISVIDIGSNSIKLLVADKSGILKEDFRGTRIGEGIAENDFIIKEDVIQRNIDAIVDLFNEANELHPDLTIVTGTSAVRDAHNRDEFCTRVKQAIGIDVQILSGEEEATTIARGVATDPHVKAYNEFCLFDIGGGSLECIYYKNGQVLLAKSLPLGIVRLTEKYISNPKQPISQEEIQKIKDAVIQSVPGFPINGLPLVGSGGGFTEAKKLLQSDSILQVSDLERLLSKLSSITMESRIKYYDILPFRADVMPAALAIIIALANKAEVKEVMHSHFSLRFGLVAQALED